MARAQIRTRTKREMLPSVSPPLVAGMLMLAEFAAFAILAGRTAIVVKSLVVVLPLLFFIARPPVIGIYGLTFLVPL